jgi:hypothetical protein
MRPTQEVSQIVGDFRPSWLVFENFIPKEHVNDLDNTQVLLTELNQILLTMETEPLIALFWQLLSKFSTDLISLKVCFLQK